MKSDKKSRFENKNFVIIIIIITVSSLLTIFLVLNMFHIDTSNNATLIVEIAVGVIIAIIIYHLTKKSERINKEVLHEIKEIVGEEKKLRDSKRDGFVKDVRSISIIIFDMFDSIERFDEPSEAYFSELNSLYGRWHKLENNYVDVLSGNEFHLLQSVTSDIERMKSKMDYGTPIKSTMSQIREEINELMKIPLE